MGMISDFVDGILDSIKSFLLESSEGNIGTAMDILSDGLHTSSSGNGIMNQLLATSPENYTAGGTNSIWSTIQSITENAVVPIAGCILMIVLVNDLIQIVISGNNFHEFDTSIFIRWILKCVIGIILISNVFYITSGIFALGTAVTTNAMSSALHTINLNSNDIHIAGSYGMGECFGILVLSLLLLLIMVIAIAIIVVTLCSRMIEIFMYLGASPLPMATFMNQEWKQMGHSWLRGVIALAFQGFFIVICIAIFSVLFKNVVATLSSGSDVLLQMVFLIGYALALIFTILRSGQISKSIFGAH